MPPFNVLWSSTKYAKSGSQPNLGLISSTDNTQDVSLQIAEDRNLSVEDSLHDFFEPEILDGENACWCDTCKKACRATKTLSSVHTNFYDLNNPLKKTDTGGKNTSPHYL